MAEFIIRVVDKVNPNSAHKDARCLKRGDVVAVVDNNWPWSQNELTHPQWRVVKCPDLTVSEASAFLTPEVGDVSSNPLLRRRAFFLDIDNLPTAHRNWFNDDTRSDPVRVIPGVVMTSNKRLKEPLQGSAIGDVGNVIG